MKAKSSGWGGNRRFNDHDWNCRTASWVQNPRVEQTAKPTLHLCMVPPQDRSRQAWFSVPVEHYLVTVEFHN